MRAVVEDGDLPCVVKPKRRSLIVAVDECSERAGDKTIR